ncbi:hypothetical protein [Streptomyces katsurahamanus]|uniref:CBM2 domain-containing protein n=1 Tax=Streptomyces katsurahamanus TaxID=2577098 RepID=A0ABW9P1M8_9ACTN|nr:hypothetical protein [Streptomyces katsurahamanus]MQS39465.1 hypothetical protein [Streptomyces katsurahamanus]
MSRGRRGTTALAALTATAALCLGGALVAYGGDDGEGEGEGYAAVGPAGPGRASAVPPKGGIALVPLDDLARRSGPSPTGGAPVATASGPPGAAPTSGGADRPAAPGPDDGPARSGTTPSGTTPSGPAPSGPASGTGDPADPDGGPSGVPQSPTGRPGPSPSGPAVLKIGDPVRTPLDRRWCEQVTVEFRNTGDVPATSGTVTFGTHIIGALGVDWATIESAQPLPAPIAARSARTAAYTVCVDAWRVPPGMRIETQDVSAVWR